MTQYLSFLWLINFLVLQLLFVRIARINSSINQKLLGYGLVWMVIPFTGWCSRYIFVWKRPIWRFLNLSETGWVFKVMIWTHRKWWKIQNKLGFKSDDDTYDSYASFLKKVRHLTDKEIEKRIIYFAIEITGDKKGMPRAEREDLHAQSKKNKIKTLYRLAHVYQEKK